jgi:transposase
VLKSAFSVSNSSQGAEELLRLVCTTAKQRRIPLKQVFFAGEDHPSFAQNFERRLRQEQFTVVRVNAWEAKQHRSNFQASTDALDLLCIARHVLNRRGEIITQWPEPYVRLQIVSRDRDKLVRHRTAVANRMHNYVDRLFPGFLNPQKSGLNPFGPACLELMSQGFSAQALGALTRRSLGARLKRQGVEAPAEVATQLKELAAEALLAAPDQADMLQRSLTHFVELYRGLSRSISSLDRELAFWLARTPGALLTSIGGIGVTLAAGWMAELGPPKRWRGLRRICSYGGVVPSTKQSGGPDKAPVTGPVQQRCNKRFKNAVLRAVDQVRVHGPEDLIEAARQLEAQGSHVEFALAKRLIRLGKYLTLNHSLYLPKALFSQTSCQSQRADYYAKLWPKLLEKWQEKAVLSEVFAPDQPLGQWRQMAQEAYGLELRLPKQRAAQSSRTKPT